MQRCCAHHPDRGTPDRRWLKRRDNVSRVLAPDDDFRQNSVGRPMNWLREHWNPVVRVDQLRHWRTSGRRSCSSAYLPPSSIKLRVGALFDEFPSWRR